MKRFCLDFITLTMGLMFVLLLGALIEGTLPTVGVLAGMLSLAYAICLTYRESARLEQEALRAKRQRKAQLLRAKRNHAVQTACAQAAAQKNAVACAANQGLYVA